MAVMPFATGTHYAQSLAVDTEQLVNLYPRLSQTGKSITTLYTRPGLVQTADLGIRPARGIHVTGDSISRFTVWSVAYSNLIRQVDGGTPEHVGALDSTEGPVYMASNGRQVMVTDGVAGYIYDIAGSSFVKLDQPTHGWTVQQPRFVTYLSTYFVVMDAADGRYYISDNYNGLQWNAADFGVAETDPDGMVCIVADHGELWLFGTRTTEVHFNSGAAAFPFEPKLGATLEWGTPAPFTVCKFDNTLAFLGQSGRGGLRMFRLEGYLPVRISDDGLEERFREYTTFNDATAYGWDSGGNAFLMLTFPTENVSWLYNQQSQQWTKALSAGGRHIGQYAVGREQRTIVTDYRDGRIYDVADVEADGDIPIYVRAVGRTMNEQEQWLDHDALEVVVERGTGPQSLDPQMMLRWSNDNGYTWSSEYWRSMGPVGRYARRAKWNRLGRARNRTYELAITDSAPKRIVGIVLNGGA